MAQVKAAARDVAAGEHARAKQALESAAELAPDWPATHYHLAVAHTNLNEWAAAERAIRTTLELQPNFPNAAHLLGGVLCQRERVEEAMYWLRKGVEADPKSVAALRDLAVAQMFLGDLKAARENLLQVIEADPTSAQVLPMIVELTPADQFPAEALRVKKVLMRMAETADSLPESLRIELYTALFRAHDQRGDTDTAFFFAERAADLKRSGLNYNIDADEALADAVMGAFEAPLFERLKNVGAADPRPIFILGLPRSGTTLTEQILCAHPDVFGAGETTTMLSLVARITGKNGEAYPDWCPDMSGADARLVGDAYLSRLPKPSAAESRTTDKRLENFLNIGLIALALPNAAIIHCRRDPRDMAFSCYTTLFSGGQEWSYDMGEIARYHRLHERVMAHWNRVLPGRILEVQYEDIVADLPGQARRIVEHCGLTWDSACLKFHETRRPVRSASLIQVRRPIYESSVGRWRPYAAKLAPLFEALEAD